MPRANVYIRKENWEAWEASSKSDWINESLQSTLARPDYIIGLSPSSGDVIPMTVDATEIIPMTTTPVIGIDQAERLRKAQEDKGVTFCKHSQVKGFCKLGCK